MLRTADSRAHHRAGGARVATPAFAPIAAALQTRAPPAARVRSGGPSGPRVTPPVFVAADPRPHPAPPAVVAVGLRARLRVPTVFVAAGLQARSHQSLESAAAVHQVAPRRCGDARSARWCARLTAGSAWREIGRRSYPAGDAPVVSASDALPSRPAPMELVPAPRIADRPRDGRLGGTDRCVTVCRREQPRTQPKCRAAPDGRFRRRTTESGACQFTIELPLGGNLHVAARAVTRRVRPGHMVPRAVPLTIWKAAVKPRGGERAAGAFS